MSWKLREKKENPKSTTDDMKGPASVTLWFTSGQGLFFGGGGGTLCSDEQKRFPVSLLRVGKRKNAHS